MDKLYYFLIIIVGITLVTLLIYFLCKRYPYKSPVFKLRLLFFDGEIWYADVLRESGICRGFIELPKVGHKIGEEINATIEGSLFIQHFDLEPDLPSSDNEIYKIRLLYFDEEIWYCESDCGFGLIELDADKYCVGEELDAVARGLEVMYTFRALSLCESDVKNKSINP